MDMNVATREMTPTERVASASEQFQMAVGRVAEAALVADNARRDAAIANDLLDEAHRTLGDAHAAFVAILEQFGLTPSGPKVF
jgi:hypothetical protein